MKSVLFLTTLLSTTLGCGTTGNLFQERPAYYGGISGDFSTFHEYRDHENQSLGYDVMWASFLALDVPLSAVGDTITLPYVWLASTLAPTSPAPPADWP